MQVADGIGKDSAGFLGNEIARNIAERMDEKKKLRCSLPLKTTIEKYMIVAVLILWASCSGLSNIRATTAPALRSHHCWALRSTGQASQVLEQLFNNSAQIAESV